jgi:predicted Zn finger-like uncharacterized protein
MIAACPTCGARYRIDVSKLRPEGARLRCARCEAVFRVRPPVEPEPSRATAGASPPPAMTFDDEAPAAAPRTRAPSAPAAAPAWASARSEAPAAPAPRAAPRDRERLVLVADSQPESGKELAATLNDWGCETLLVHDGVEAILNVQRALPRVVVLDAALPKMFGFQVCELMKRNESLRGIHVVLVGAIHDQQRYRRPPGELYGADVYVERHELPGALGPLLERFGIVPRGSAAEAPSRTPELVRPAPSPVPPRRAAPPPQPAPPRRAAPPPQPAPSRAAAPRASGDPLDEARAQAERLARIIVSDIVLYNAEKFEAGVRSGDVIAVLGAELDEGRSLFAARIDPRVGTADEFLQRELLRVARTRGMAG